MSAPGQHSLSTLLQTLKPVLQPETYKFLTIPTSLVEDDAAASLAAVAVMTFREPNHPTSASYIVPAAAASRLYSYLTSAYGDHPNLRELQMAYTCKMITLDVHSSLEAVGFMARIAGRLAENGISSNVVSGFWSDHLFVDERHAHRTLHVLEALSDEAYSMAQE